MRTYGQYCPISRAAEALGDRWTILIVRDLMTGTNRFNELIRGNPGLSRALLSKRLDQLRRAGLVEGAADGSYRLTPAGDDLHDVVFGLAAWGARWAFGEPRADELDPDLLLWWVHRSLDVGQLPDHRFVVHVHLADHRKRYWIVVDGDASVCFTDPRFDVDVVVRTDVPLLYNVYLGRRRFVDAVASGEVQLTGSTAATRALVRAFVPSVVADLVAEAEGEAVSRVAGADVPGGAAEPTPA